VQFLISKPLAGAVGYLTQCILLCYCVFHPPTQTPNPPPPRVISQPLFLAAHPFPFPFLSFILCYMFRLNFPLHSSPMEHSVPSMPTARPNPKVLTYLHYSLLYIIVLHYFRILCIHLSCKGTGRVFNCLPVVYISQLPNSSYQD
jgi:hypothetical protein